jgi:hypothetical protein
MIQKLVVSKKFTIFRCGLGRTECVATRCPSVELILFPHHPMWPRDGSTSPFVRIVAQSSFPPSGLNYAITPHPSALTSTGNPLTSGCVQDIPCHWAQSVIRCQAATEQFPSDSLLDLTWIRDRYITAAEAPWHSRPLANLHRASLVWVNGNSLRSKQTAKLYLADGSADGQKTKGNSSGKWPQVTVFELTLVNL